MKVAPDRTVERAKRLVLRGHAASVRRRRSGSWDVCVCNVTVASGAATFEEADRFSQELLHLFLIEQDNNQSKRKHTNNPKEEIMSERKQHPIGGDYPCPCDSSNTELVTSEISAGHRTHRIECGDCGPRVVQPSGQYAAFITQEMAEAAWRKLSADARRQEQAESQQPTSTP